MPQEFTQWNVGDVILNLYKATSFLGEGGFGKVYKVRHLGWNIDLAVKIPKPSIVEAAGGINKFERQAQTWVDLGLHPHTVSCYYVRRYEGTPLVFAEYVASGSLQDWIRSRQLYVGAETESLKRILDIAIQIAWGLHYAHTLGVIHQNVKSANVMLTAEGVAKVTDIGVHNPSTMAAIFNPLLEQEEQGEDADADRTLMIEGGGLWTQAYRSPEQALAEPLTRRTDLWSWGLCVLEMFTGDRTWLDGTAAAQALTHYLQCGAEDPQVPKMPVTVSQLLQRCFQDNPDDRFHDLLEVAHKLKEIYQQETADTYPRPEPQTGIQADSLNNQAVSLLDLGSEEEALQLWEQALQLQPEHPESIYNRGLTLWRSGRINDDYAIVRELEVVQKSRASDWIVNYLLGLVHLERGDCDRAKVTFKNIKGLWAEQEEVQAALAQALERLPHSNRLLHNFVGHTWGISSVCMSDDGRYALSGSHDRTLKMWEVSTGRCLRTFEGHTWGVYAVGLSADARSAVSVGGDYTLKLWEVASERCVHTVEGHVWDLKTVCLSKDTQFVLSASSDNSLNLWEIATGEPIRTFDALAHQVKAVTLSADNRFALSGGEDNTLKLWDVATAECIRDFEGHAESVKSVCLSEDAQFALSGSEDKTLKLWQVSTGECLRTFEGHSAAVNSVCLSADGQFALSGSDDNTLKLWEVFTGRCLRTFTEDIKEAYLIVYLSEDARFALTVSGADPLIATSLKLWAVNYSTDSYRAPMRLSQARETETAISSGLTYEWELDAAREASQRGDYAAAAAHVRKARSQPGYSRRANAFQSWTSLYIRLRRTAFRDCWESATFAGHKDGVNSVALSKDGQIALSGSADNTLKLWDVATGRCIRTFEGHMYEVYSVCLSEDGRFSLSGSDDKTVKLWDVATGECIRTFEGQAVVFAVCFSADARFSLSGNGDGTLKLWEVATGRCLRTFTGRAVVLCACLSADGRFALSGSLDNTIDLWDVATGECIRTFVGHAREVKSVCLSEGARFSLSGSGDNSVKLWEVATGECIRTFVGHKSKVNSVCLSSDGKFALSGSDDNTVKLWEVSTGRCLRTVEGHTSKVNSIGMSSDGRFALSGSKDKTLKLWVLDWELEERQPADWDARARPYLENFLTLLTPYAANLPEDREPLEEEIRLALTRSGTPTWTEDDVASLLYTLGCAGYGWLRREGVLQQLEAMVGNSPQVTPIESPQMWAKVVLTVTSGSLNGQKFGFEERTTCIIGRANDCYPKLPNDAAHSTISRYHCLLDINPPEIRVRDFGSKNGTYVNGKKIGQRQADELPEERSLMNFPEYDLHDGDEIKLSNTVFRVSIEVGVGSEDESMQTATWEIAAPQQDAREIIPRLVQQARAGDPNLVALSQYTILKQQGVGRFGAVYLARDSTTDRVVALKVMLPQILPSQGAIEMFLREAANSIALQHPNIVQLGDYGYDAGSFFFIMEYCAGGSAADLIEQRGGRLSIDEAVPIILQVLDGLQYAHNAEIPYVKRANGTIGKGRGFVHRELVPANIFLSNVGEKLSPLAPPSGGDAIACGSARSAIAKIGDYGLAKAFDMAGLSGQTMSGTNAGTPFFMPRQQVINFKYAQPEVDIWATAACLYYMLTGSSPRNFTDSDPFLVVLQTNPVPIRQRNADIPQRLAEIIDLALVDKPEIYFKNAATFKQALLRVL